MANEVVIEIPQGKLKGLKEENYLGDVYYSYNGIPYAKPPISSLRFESPQPAEGWQGVRDATKEGPVCPSYSIFNGVFLEESDEDSLLANVYTKQPPDEPSKKLPVMIRIHGGGNTTGSGNRGLLGPDFLMRRDIVYVTFNYRLGALGFLSLQTSDCPGNFGLKDQRLLFKWVQENISYFGGDPNNVTLIGESSGAASVHYHLLSPTTKGLFHRTIMHSGSALSNVYSQHPREVAFLLGRRLGLETDDDEKLLEFLKKASVRDIVKHSYKLLSELFGERAEESIINFAFNPTVEPVSEDAMVTEHPWVLIQQGNFHDLPMIAGNCSTEMLGVGISRIDQLPNWTKDEEFKHVVPRYFNLETTSDLSLEIAQRIRRFYFRDGITLENFVDCLSDIFYVFGVYQMVKAQAANPKFQSPAYLFLFSYEGGRSPIKETFGLKHLPGVAHMEDLSYILSSPDIPPPEIGSSDHEVITKFVDLWVGFATTGKPKKEIEWKPADQSSMNHLDMDKEFTPKGDFFKERMRFWEEMMELVRSKWFEEHLKE